MVWIGGAHLVGGKASVVAGNEKEPLKAAPSGISPWRLREGGPLALLSILFCNELARKGLLLFSAQWAEFLRFPLSCDSLRWRRAFGRRCWRRAKAECDGPQDGDGDDCGDKQALPIECFVVHEKLLND